MNDPLKLVLPSLRSVQGYDGVESPEAMAEASGIPIQNIIRLNGNENSHGSSPKVAEAMAVFNQYNRYPDPQQIGLRKALSGYTGTEPEGIVAGNGSDEIIDLIVRLFVGPGDKIIEPSPTFGMYGFSAKLVGAEVVQVPRDEAFEVDVEQIRMVTDSRTKVIFLASPNNPTGNVAAQEQICRLLDLGVIVVVDEAYYEYCGQTSLSLLDEYPNLIVLRTFSKWAGLAGLRVGLGIMVPELARLMLTIKPPYNVNRAAEIAMIASLEDRELLMARIKPVIQERERLFDLLSDIDGVTPIPSQANFMMLRFSYTNGAEIYRGLAKQGIFVRYYDKPETKDCVRVSVGQPYETDRFVDALQKVLAV